MKRFFLASVMGMLISSLSFGASEIRKLGSNDLEWGTGTTVSPGGKTVTKINATHIPIVAGDNTLSVNDAVTAWVDVRAHGAVCNGTTIDTTAIRAAVTAARAANAATEVWFPWTRCRIDNVIDGLDGVVLRGKTKWYGGLYTTDNITMISANGLAYFGVHNLALTGPGKGTNSIGISLNAGSSMSSVSDVYITGIGTAVYTNQDSSVLDRITVDQATKGFYFDTNSNAINLYAPQVYNSDYGIFNYPAITSRGVFVWGGVMQGILTAAIKTNGNTWSTVIDGTYFEGNLLDAELDGEHVVMNKTTHADHRAGTQYAIYSNAKSTTIRDSHFYDNGSISTISLDSGAVEAQLLNNSFESRIAENMKYSLGSARVNVVERGVHRPKAQAFTDNDTTPSVAGGTLFQTVNTGPTTITMYDNCAAGQSFEVLFTDNNTTVAHGSTLKLTGGTNFVSTPNDIVGYRCGEDGVVRQKYGSVN